MSHDEAAASYDELDLESSELGTHAYWQQAYARELDVLRELGDEGEIWCPTAQCCASADMSAFASKYAGDGATVWRDYWFTQCNWHSGSARTPWRRCWTSSTSSYTMAWAQSGCAYAYA